MSPGRSRRPPGDPDPSYVLDLRSLARQGIVRMGALVRGGRIRFVDAATRRLFGEVAFDLDTRRPDVLGLALRYELVKRGERIVLAVPLRFLSPETRGFRWRIVCPLGCRREVLRLHLPGGAARFGCGSCHRTALRSSEGPPAIRPAT